MFSKIPRKEISVFEKRTGVIGVSEKSRIILDWYKNRKQNRRLARKVVRVFSNVSNATILFVP